MGLVTPDKMNQRRLGTMTLDELELLFRIANDDNFIDTYWTQFSQNGGM